MQCMIGRSCRAVPANTDRQDMDLGTTASGGSSAVWLGTIGGRAILYTITGSEQDPGRGALAS